MYYKDQLVLTGNINDTGAPIRINVPDSYRMGVEVTGKALLGQHFVADANATISQNKIMDFREHVDNWETLKPLLMELDERERRILELRFGQEWTQSQIADDVGISQMHVSRILARTLAQLRSSMLDEY